MANDHSTESVPDTHAARRMDVADTLAIATIGSVAAIAEAIDWIA